MPTRLVPDYTPRGPLTDYKLRDAQNAINRNLAIATVNQRSVDLSAATFDLMQITDNTIIFSATAAASNFTFLAARTMPNIVVTLDNEGASAVTLTPTGSDVIDDATIPAGSRYTYQSDGQNEGHWKRISGTTPAAPGVTSVHADANANITGAVQLVSGTEILLAEAGQAITVNFVGGTTFRGVRVNKNAATTISDATPTILGFNQERYDTNGFHDNATNNSRLTIPATDFYDVSANVEWNHDTTGIAQYLLELLVNGTMLTSTTATTVVGSTTQQFLRLENQLLTAADYLQVRVTLTNGAHIGTVDINTHGDYYPLFTASVIQ